MKLASYGSENDFKEEENTMRLFKRLAAGASALALAATMAASGLAPAMTVTAADDCNDDWLHAVGSKLYDKDGNQVWLTGANWFGLNCSENAPHGLYAQEADPFLSAVADHGINVIRFPISTELVVSWMKGKPNEVNSVQAWGDETNGFNLEFLQEDGKTLKNSQEIFDILLAKCKKYGLKCFIDIHSPHSDNSGHNYNLWYGLETETAGMITTDVWIESLTWLAERYANDDTVLGYDLKNEPHGKGQEGDKAAKWDGSTDENNWQYAATKCAKSILKVNPNALIFIEGVEQSMSGAMPGDVWGIPDRRDNSPYIGAWWGGNLRGVKEHPVDLGDPKMNSQIVYSPHDYGPSVYNQTWFDKDFTTETLLDDYWRDTWAYINEENIAPLLIGEWGGHMDDGKNQHWMELLRDYMIENHINHTFWCLNPNSGDTGGLLGNDFKTWDKAKYALMEPSLWQTNSSGKYIGLDHQRPLGVNDTGISLSDYYATYDKSEGSNINGGKGTGKSDPVTIETQPTKATEPTTKPTEPTTKPTEPTEPTTKPTEPTTKPTEPTTAPPTAPTEWNTGGYNYSVTILTVDEDGNGVAGVTVKVSDNETYTSDKNGKIQFLYHQDIRGASVSVTAVPDGYNLPESAESIRLNGPGPEVREVVTIPSKTAATDPNNSDEPTTEPAAAAVTLYGDINLDKSVDIMDVIALNKFLLGLNKLEGSASANADVDQSKKVDANDALYILKKALDIIPELPVKK